MADLFICEMCGQRFEKGRPDKEAMAETKEIYGRLLDTELAVVCDDCYRKIDPSNHLHEVEEAMSETLRARDPFNRL